MWALLREMGHIKKLVPWKSTTELMDEDDSRYPVQLGKFSSFAKVPTLKLIDKLRLLVTGIKLFFSRNFSRAPQKIHLTALNWRPMIAAKTSKIGRALTWAHVPTNMSCVQLWISCMLCR